jgi:multidrug efflux system outer membrane protein
MTATDSKPTAHRLPWRRKWNPALCALGLLLAGCAHQADDILRPGEPDVPIAWGTTLAATAGTASESAAAWWQHFQDPVLASLVARALQANTTVLGAQAALRQARALRDVAAAGLQPTLGSSASASHGTRGDDSTGNSFQLGLDASWELDLFGAGRSAVETSEATARASAASLGDVQVSIAAEVALSLITLRSSQARLAIAQANLPASCRPCSSPTGAHRPACSARWRLNRRALPAPRRRPSCPRCRRPSNRPAMRWPC